MPAEIPVDLTKTGGRLVPPWAGQKPAAPQAPTPPAADKTAEHDPKADDHPKNCKMCGWNNELDPQLPDPGDPVAFRDAVFRGVPYQKTVPVFDGAGSVTFKDLTADENEAVRMKVDAESIEKPFKPFDMIARYTELCLGFAVTAVQIGGRRYAAEPVDDPFVLGDTDGPHKALRKWLGSDTVYRTVRMAYGKFVAQLGYLIARAGEPSFFTATGPLGGQPESPPVN